jgi:hypothetical protein
MDLFVGEIEPGVYGLFGDCDCCEGADIVRIEAKSMAEAEAEFRRIQALNPGPCFHGDPHCPCQDGLMCHYEGPDPMRCPRTGIVGCKECR